MSPRATLATAGRVLAAAPPRPADARAASPRPAAPADAHDVRVRRAAEETFDRVGAPLVGIFPFISMFLVTSIAMLRERTTGRSSG